MRRNIHTVGKGPITVGHALLYQERSWHNAIHGAEFVPPSFPYFALNEGITTELEYNKWTSYFLDLVMSNEAYNHAIKLLLSTPKIPVYVSTNAVLPLLAHNLAKAVIYRSRAPLLAARLTIILYLGMILESGASAL